MNFKISKRLKNIINNVSENDVVADIGTDHALIPIFLSLNNIAKKVYATDVCKGPLEQAEKNIIKFLTSRKKIFLIQDFGLKWIDKQKIDSCIISGMGANSVLEILADDNINIKRFIISPNNQTYKIRQWVKNNGYFIEQESFIKENDFIYEIIVINKNKGKTINFDYQIYMGIELAKKYPDLYTENFNNQFNNLELIINKINPKIPRYKILEKELKTLKEYYKEGLKNEDKRCD